MFQAGPSAQKVTYAFTAYIKADEEGKTKAVGWICPENTVEKGLVRVQSMLSL
jgi:hypothetical protein